MIKEQTSNVLPSSWSLLTLVDTITDLQHPFQLVWSTTHQFTSLLFCYFSPMQLRNLDLVPHCRRAARIVGAFSGPETRQSLKD